MGNNIPEWQGSLNTKSASNSWVQLRSSSYGTVTVLADSNGIFSVNGIPSGTYTLWTGATQNGPWTQQDSNYVIQLPLKTTVASDFFASNPATGTYGSKTSIVVGPTNVNLQSEGADMSGATDSRAAWVKAFADLPSGGGEIYVGPGTLKISSADANNNALTVTGGPVKVRGAGRNATTLNITQTGLTWGVALTQAQQELADMTVNAVAGIAAPFWLVGMPGVPGRSAEQVRFVRVTANVAAGATIPTPPTGVNDGVHSAVGAGIIAVGPDYPTTSSFDAGLTHFEECFAISQCTTTTTNLVSGFLIGNGTGGNVVAITASDCEVNTVTFGIQLAGGGMRWNSGSFSNNIDTDIYLEHSGGDPIVFTGLRGENGGRIIWGANTGPTPGGLVLVGCEFDLFTPNPAIVGTGQVAGQVIRWNAAGTLVIVGGRMSTIAHNTTFAVNTDGNGFHPSLLTMGLSTDVNPYPAANPSRFMRTVILPSVGLDLADQVPGAEINDGGAGGVYRARAYRAAALNITSNSVPIVVVFDTVTAGDDPNGNFSVGAGTYTAPVAGRYSLDVRLNCQTSAANIRAILGAYVGGTEKVRGTDVVLTSSNNTLTIKADMRLAAADVVDVRLNILDNVAKAFDVGSALAYFDISWQGA